MEEPTSSPSPENKSAPKKLARPHRCNDRVEDLIQALYTLDFANKISPAWSTLRACLKSEPGFEPQGGHVCVKDPSLFLDPLKMRRPEKSEAIPPR